MGRPNWWRVRACSAAVSRHQRAPPTASAEATSRASSRMRSAVAPSSSRSGGTTVPSTTQSADRRDGSKLGRASTRTDSPRSSRTQRTSPSTVHRGQHARRPRPVGNRADGAVDRERAVVTGATGQARPGDGRTVRSTGGDDQRGGQGAVGQPGQELLGLGLAARTRPPPRRPPPWWPRVRAPRPGPAPRPPRPARSSRPPGPRTPRADGWPRVPWAPRSAQKSGRRSASASSAALVTSGGQRRLDPAPDREPELVVLVTDPDRHRSGSCGRPGKPGRDRFRRGGNVRTGPTLSSSRPTF